MCRRITFFLPRNFVLGVAEWYVEMFIALGGRYFVGTAIVGVR